MKALHMVSKSETFIRRVLGKLMQAADIFDSLHEVVSEAPYDGNKKGGGILSKKFKKLKYAW
jgi:hypothetical protein